MIIFPANHWESIGFGNKMSFKKSIVNKLGGFAEWLGPGSLVNAAEDAEMAQRILINNYKLYYSADSIVYHNRWLNIQKSEKQNLNYFSGEISYYSYFAFGGYSFGEKTISYNLKLYYLILY